MIWRSHTRYSSQMEGTLTSSSGLVGFHWFLHGTSRFADLGSQFQTLENTPPVSCGFHIIKFINAEQFEFHLLY